MIASGSLVPGIDPAEFRLPAGTAIRYEQPHAQLRRLLPSYAVLDSDPEVWRGPDSWLLPGWQQLWFVLTDGPVTVAMRRRPPTQLVNAILYGPTSTAMPVTSRGGITVVVDVSPIGWARWFDQPANALRDKAVPLEQLWPTARVDALVAGLRGFERPEEIAPMLDDFFLSTLPSPHRDEAALEQVMATMFGEDGGSITDVLHWLGIGRSTLQRLVNRHCGFGLKMLGRRARFLRVIAPMLANDELPNRTAAPPGYYDASHFLRDSNDFLGLTPRRFLSMPMPYLRAALRARSMVIGAALPILDVPR